MKIHQYPSLFLACSDFLIVTLRLGAILAYRFREVENH